MDDLDAVSRQWNEHVRASSEMEEMALGLASGEHLPDFLIPGFAKFFVLRPLLLSSGQVADLKAMSQTVLGAHRKVLEKVLGSDVLKERHFSGLFEWTEEVLDLDRPGPIRALCLRFDGSLVDGRPVFFELNADMPQGVGLFDSFTRFLQGLPPCREMAEKYAAGPVLLQEAFLQAILAEWRESGGTGDPVICFVTWSDEPVRRKDAELDCAYFVSRGVDAMVADPRELECRGGKLSARGTGIDVVYRVVSTGETVERAADMKALVDAEKAGGVLMVNSFRSELMGNKAMFALLHDEDCRSAFTPAEKDAVRRCIPWTRVLREERCADPSGTLVDLLEWVAGHREDLVLKPTHDFGGHGVTLGSQCDESEWESALSDALEHDFIVQHRIRMGRGTFPVAERGLPLKELYEDIDPFMLGNAYAGCITRLSEDELTNVHLHGAMGAVFELPVR